jgi:hypothetical protein
VRKLTGRVPASSKFGDPEGPRLSRVLDEAEQVFERERDQLTPVVVI